MTNQLESFENRLRIYQCKCGHKFTVPKYRQEVECLYCGTKGGQMIDSTRLNDFIEKQKQERLIEIEKHLSEDLHLNKCKVCQKWQVKENFTESEETCESCLNAIKESSKCLA